MSKVFVAFDICTETPPDRRRYRRLVALLSDRGIRVQESVFEIQIRPRSLVKFNRRLRNCIQPDRNALLVLSGKAVTNSYPQDGDQIRGFKGPWII